MRLTLLSLLMVLGGCSSLGITPKELPENAPTSERAVAQHVQMTEAWNQAPVYTEGKASVVLLTPMALPPEIKNKRISLELEPGTTITDIVAILGRVGVPVITGDPDVIKKEFYLPRFNGTVGALLSTITRATDVWFTWHDGAIAVNSKERIGVSVPQES